MPQPLPFNVSMCGPVLINFGTEAQKKRFLPRMAALDDWWCQGFSEPGAGSDLAGLKTTAVRQGRALHRQRPEDLDDARAVCRLDLLPVPHRPGGQEAARHLVHSDRYEDARHHGAPDRDHRRRQEVNEVFFDDVKVPVENLVGQENRGWDCAKFLLGNERTGIARVGLPKQRVARIKELAAKVMAGDRPLIEDARFREKVAAVEVELKALEMTQLRVLAEDRNRKSNQPNPASSILKIKGSEMQQATTELLMEIAGPLALPYRRRDDDAATSTDLDWARPLAPQYFNYRKVSIYGGSNEIQRNIIAKAVLGF